MYLLRIVDFNDISGINYEVKSMNDKQKVHIEILNLNLIS